MNIRFQADANLDPDIARGVQLREPSIDFRPARGVLADGTLDPEVLRIAAADGRVLVTRDVRTMRGHFEEFLKSSDSPGILLISNGHSTGTAIDGLLYVWLTWTEDQLRNQIHFLPRI
ncbi:MAG: hypothetical protein FJW32_06385 [Acidobacteria bacterium]|nr:hypothetical protein [Acidobacteriota bacterium]